MINKDRVIVRSWMLVDILWHLHIACSGWNPNINEKYYTVILRNLTDCNNHMNKSKQYIHNWAYWIRLIKISPGLRRRIIMVSRLRVSWLHTLTMIPILDMYREWIVLQLCWWTILSRSGLHSGYWYNWLNSWKSGKYCNLNRIASINTAESWNSSFIKHYHKYINTSKNYKSIFIYSYSNGYWVYSCN